MIEWIADAFDPQHKLLCGGSRYSSDPLELEATSWSYSTPDSRGPRAGFRCAL